jgi:hypothetical protein
MRSNTSSVNGRPNRLGYSIPIIGGGNGGGTNPADSTTYYMGADTESNLHTVYANVSQRIPKAGVLKKCFLNVIKNAAGSGEAVPCSIRVNDATDVALGNMVWTGTADKLWITTLNQAVAEGDTFVFKFVSPAWVTNPTGVRVVGFIYIE